MRRLLVSDAPADAPKETRDSYGLALAALLCSVLLVIAAGAPISSYVALVSVGLSFLALGLTLRVSGVSRQRFRISAWVLLAVFVGLGVAVLAGGRPGAFIALTAWLILALTAIVSIAVRLKQYNRINLPFVLGLLCVYLLIGLSFGLAFLLVEMVDPPAFSQDNPGLSGTVYFSFITLATVGYGDYSPVHSLVRAMAVAEAILGQLYLVSVVSLAVSRLGAGRGDISEPENT